MQQIKAFQESSVQHVSVFCKSTSITQKNMEDTQQITWPTGIDKRDLSGKAHGIFSAPKQK